MSDQAAEIALLRRQLDRERRARRTAEEVGERSTAQLFDAVQELLVAQDQVRQHLDVQLLINQLSSSIREDLDPQGILRRAVSSIGAAVGADRCLIRLVDGAGIGGIVEQWGAVGVRDLDLSTVLPTALEQLCLASARRRESLVVDDVLTDSRLAPSDAAEVRDKLGVSSYLGTPMWMGSELVGWLVLHSTSAPRPWTARQLAVIEGVADVLGIALMQAQAHAGQAEAIQRLQMVDRAKTEFVLTVSHELRTPVTSISLYAELLSDVGSGPLNGEQLDLLAVIHRNTERLLNLVEDLLSLSRIDSGAAVAAREEVDLRTLLGDACRTLLPIATAHGLEVIVDCDVPVPAVRGNRDELVRVLLNVLSNAVKFTPRGGVVTAALSADGDQVVLVVTDTGHGVSPADLPFVFDRFYRAAAANERAIEGTGLGLAVVKSTVEQHGGSVTMTSELDHGSIVTIALPTSPVGLVASGAVPALRASTRAS